MGDLDEVGRQLVWSSSKHSPGEEWWREGKTDLRVTREGR